MRRETADLVGSGLLLAALLLALVAALAPTGGAGAATAASVPTAADASDPVARGRMLFHAKGCIACHSKLDEPEANGNVGPDLTGLFARADARRPGMSAQDYIRESIRTPSAFVVPGYEGGTFGMPDLGLADDEIDALIAYFIATTQQP